MSENPTDPRMEWELRSQILSSSGYDQVCSWQLMSIILRLASFWANTRQIVQTCPHAARGQRVSVVKSAPAATVVITLRSS